MIRLLCATATKIAAKCLRSWSKVDWRRQHVKVFYISLILLSKPNYKKLCYRRRTARRELLSVVQCHPYLEHMVCAAVIIFSIVLPKLLSIQCISAFTSTVWCKKNVANHMRVWKGSLKTAMCGALGDRNPAPTGKMPPATTTLTRLKWFSGICCSSWRRKR